MVPVVLAGKGREAVGRVTDEAANRVGVQGQEKGNEQVVHVPKRFERLLSNPMMSGRVHQEHAEQHHMAGDATGLDIVDLHSRHWADLCLLDVIEAVPG
jgi:hypothetical protein